jgi:pyruvate/2-oxoglutarate dehydrogenase complex dihydrolipoamide acyltransferase (E2) component
VARSAGGACSPDNRFVSAAEIRDVVMPDLQGAEEITVGAWSKQRGEHVSEGETLMEAHTDKVNAEIPSPVAGTVEELLLDVGDAVKPGQPIARIAPE